MGIHEFIDEGKQMSEQPIKGQSVSRKKGKQYLPVKILMIVVAALLFMALIATTIWYAMKSSGYQNLYQKWSGKAPTMNLEELNEGEAEVGWQDDWIRYDGKVYQYNENILTFLIMGIDKKSEVEETTNGVSGGQSDANFLVVMDPDKETIQLICINRDSMTNIDVYDYLGNYSYTTTAQLALQHAYGSSNEENADNMVQAVSNLLYGLPIHGYCAIHMSAIEDINDAMGGVTVTCLDDLTKYDASLRKGATVTLKGKQAYHYTHDRDLKAFESNRARLQRQKQYLGAFVTQAKKAVSKNPTVTVSLYNNLKKYMTTDLTLDEVTYLVSTAMEYSFDTDSVVTLEGQTKMGDFYEEFYPDEEALQKLVVDTFYEEVQN